VGAEREDARRDPWSAHPRLDAAQRHGRARSHVRLAGAVYSPDGTKIAYLQCAGDCGDPQLVGQGSIWVMNANGSGKHRIFNGDNEVQPSDRLSWGTS
jgi:Tol biopolymer transport system component